MYLDFCFSLACYEVCDEMSFPCILGLNLDASPELNEQHYTLIASVQSYWLGTDHIKP